VKKIGIIGGMGPEATVQYYLILVKRYKELFMTDNLPEIVINSVDMKRMVDLVARKDFDGLIDFLSPEIALFEKCGIGTAAISSNTPHMVFDQLQARTSVRLISIVEVTCLAIANSRVKRVGLLGTKLTMSGGFYQKESLKYGIQIFAPHEEDQVFIHDIYLKELVNNIIKPETKTRLVEIVASLQKEFQLEGVILGGTELPLIIDQHDFPYVKVFNTTRIHIDSILKAVSD
jgi:aspartate racemase